MIKITTSSGGFPRFPEGIFRVGFPYGLSALYWPICETRPTGKDDADAGGHCAVFMRVLDLWQLSW